VRVRWIRNKHLASALRAQALGALNASPGARACYGESCAAGTT
jgi:hypothetical protein